MISRHIEGEYLRVADPTWLDPIDPTYASARGGRWNAPGAHDVLYLNEDRHTARANVRRQFEGLPYGPEDLAPDKAPILVPVDVPPGQALDLLTEEGLLSVGLPPTYPEDHSGDEVPHSDCQPVGREAFEAELDGVACRSAAPGGRRELAWFPQPGRPTVERRDGISFPDWYWAAP